MFDIIFGVCVVLLQDLAAATNMTYREVNVWIFCVIWPIVTIWLIVRLIQKRNQIRALEQRVADLECELDG